MFSFGKMKNIAEMFKVVESDSSQTFLQVPLPLCSPGLEFQATEGLGQKRRSGVLGTAAERPRAPGRAELGSW